MRNKNLLKGILCGALIGSISIFSCIPTIAENVIALDSKKEAVLKINADNHKQYLKDAVVKLVQEGKLSKEKAERILEYKQKKSEELKKDQRRLMKKDGNKNSLLKELIQEGIITESEAKIIRTKLHEMKESRISDGLQGLIESGVLTSNDIENIRSYMVKDREERKARIEKLKSMTSEEIDKYFKESKKERKDIITRMVEDKIITETQAEEIKKAVPEFNKCRQKEIKK